MKVASFRENSAYRYSRGLEYQDGSFTILDAGPTTTAHVREMDVRGELEWVDPDVRRLIVGEMRPAASRSHPVRQQSVGPSWFPVLLVILAGAGVATLVAAVVTPVGITFPWNFAVGLVVALAALYVFGKHNKAAVRGARRTVLYVLAAIGLFGVTALVVGSVSSIEHLSTPSVVGSWTAYSVDAGDGSGSESGNVAIQFFNDGTFTSDGAWFPSKGTYSLINDGAVVRLEYDAQDISLSDRLQGANLDGSAEYNMGGSGDAMTLTADSTGNKYSLRRQ